jgi:hypothetical protein
MQTFLLQNSSAYARINNVVNNKERKAKQMLNLNQDKLYAVAAMANDKVLQTVKDSRLAKRWQNAIIRALVEIEVSSEWMHYDQQNDALVIWSQKSNEIYESNGSCQCKAFNQSVPCWHRAASRLVKIYNETSH